VSHDPCRYHRVPVLINTRGPAKDYLRSLQDRLQETERLLLHLLPQFSDEQLVATLQHDAVHGPSHQAWTTSLSGPDYWSKHPLNRPDSIREWQRHRTDGFIKVDHASPHQPYPSHKIESTPDVPQYQHVAPSGHNVGAIPTARMVIDDPRSYQAVAPQNPYIETGDWRQAQNSSSALNQRRYSEETRDACEALFSISNPARSASKPAEPQMKDVRPPTRHDDVPAPGLETLPAQFPKHLFW
jgi:hypothetical protein